MIPIEKNIDVIDEHGNQLEPTYPKRAKGLVKKGRARYVDEDTICLIACPPDENLEDYEMSNHTPEDMAMAISEEVNHALQENPQADVGQIVRNRINEQRSDDKTEVESTDYLSTDEITPKSILQRIDKIMADTEHIETALTALMSMPPAAGPGDIAGANQAEAMGIVVNSREETNRQILHFLEKLYDDIKPPKASDIMSKILAAIEDLPPVQKQEVIMAQLSRHW